MLFPFITLLLLSWVQIMQGHSLRVDPERLRRLEESTAPQLRTVEYEFLDLRTSQGGEIITNGANRAAAKRRSRSTNSCTQERLDAILQSCEATAPPQPQSAAADLSTRFCGAGCSHQVIEYASDCSINQEFVVNISGACKLGGENLTLQCIYAVIIARHGLTVCKKMQLGFNFMHEEVQYLFNRAEKYVDETCCSLESSYSDTPTHDIDIDSKGGVVTEPPLMPPWLISNVSDYSAIQEVTRSDLCLKPPTTTSYMDSISKTTTGKVDVVSKDFQLSAAHRTFSLSNTLVGFLCLFALLLAIVH